MNDAETITLLALNKYTRRLTCALYPQLYAGIRQIWNTSKTEARSGQVKDTFQQHLKLVPRWNQDLIDKVYRSVLDELPLRLPGATAINAPKMLEDLIARVLLLNTEVMASPFSDGRKIPVKVPPADRFVHSCYKHCARSFYVKHHLLEDRPEVTSRDRQSKNLDEANDAIVRCIEDAIEELVPLDNLLSQSVPSSKQARPESRSRSRSRGRSPPPQVDRTSTPRLFDSEDEDGDATEEAVAAFEDRPPSRPPSPQAGLGESPHYSPEREWQQHDTDDFNEGNWKGNENGNDTVEPSGTPKAEGEGQVPDDTGPEDTLTIRFNPASSDEEDNRRSRSRTPISRPRRSSKPAGISINPADLPPLPQGILKSPASRPSDLELPDLDRETEGVNYFDDA